MTTETRPRDRYLVEAELYDVFWAGLNDLDLPFYRSLTEELGGPLLELACGTGRVLLPCTPAAGSAVGVDWSESMLEQARARATAEGFDATVELVPGDMRGIRLGRTFPLVIMAGQPLWHLPTDDEWLAALRTAREHLAPGGRFAAGLPVPRFESMAAVHQQPSFAGEVRHPRTGQRIAVWDVTAFDIAEQSVTRRRVYEALDEEGLVVERRHTLLTNHYRYPREVLRLLRESGFRLEHTYGGYDRRPFGPDAEHLVWVAAAA